MEFSSETELGKTYNFNWYFKIFSHFLITSVVQEGIIDKTLVQITFSALILTYLASFLQIERKYM